MGITDLNTIMKIKGMEVKKDHFDNIIFDGSFILINTLSSVYKKLKDENKLNMTKWDTINQNLLYQMKYIIENCVNQIVKTINEFDKRYKPETIYFVVDPKNKIDYTINESLYIPNEFKEYLLNELKNDKDLEKLKLQEQESRKQRASKISDILKKCEEIEDIDLKNIYRQSNHFNEMASLTHLIRIINKYLVIKWRNSNVKFIQSIDEADLVIKNIGEELTNKNKDVLVISADTDYFVLFSANERIWVSLNHAYAPIFHPTTQWLHALTESKSKDILIEKENIYDYAIRFAALFGNDYHRTVIISAKDITNTICNRIISPSLMNSEHGEPHHNSNIYKLYSKEKALYEKYSEPVLPEELDVIIKDFMSKNEKYDFRKYLLSMVVYKNWNRFNRYEEKEVDFDIESMEKSVLSDILFIQTPNITIKLDNNTEIKNNDKVIENEDQWVIEHRQYKQLYNWNIDDEGNIEKIEKLPKNIDKLYEIYKRGSIDDEVYIESKVDLSDE